MNREIKLIVTDLDGTFVPSLGELIPENLAALRAAKEAGFVFVPVPGGTGTLPGVCWRQGNSIPLHHQQWSGHCGNPYRAV